MNFKAYIFFLLFILDPGITTNKKFKVPDYGGEIIHYTISYGIFKIGRATVSFRNDSLQCGSHIKAEAKSTGVAKFLKSINYYFECCMDTITGLPKNTSMSLIDRKEHIYNEAVFDQHSRKDSSIVYSKMSGTHIAPKNIYDILTAYYYFRKNHIPPSTKTGQDAVIKIYIADIMWDLRIRYLGIEKIKTKYGKTECFKYCPSTVAGNFFKKEDDMTMWFSNDANYIPIKARLNLILGSISIDMVEYQKPS